MLLQAVRQNSISVHGLATVRLPVQSLDKGGQVKVGGRTARPHSRPLQRCSALLLLWAPSGPRPLLGEAAPL